MKRRHITSIGLTVVVASFFLVRAILFLHPSPGDGKQILRVRFESVEKIAPGTRVAFAGKPVGEVKSVTLLSDMFDRSKPNEPIFPYEVLISVDSKVPIYTTDEISVKTSGLMGERFIVITPKAFAEGILGTKVTDKNIIYAQSSASADQALQEISRIVQKVDSTMSELSSLIHINGPNITETIGSLKTSSQSLERILTQLDASHFADKIIFCTENVGEFSKKCYDSINSNSSFGQFMTDARLYTSAVLCLDHATQLLNDINRYGIFFHTNRDFQREMFLREQDNGNFSLKSQSKFANVRKELLDLSDAVKKTTDNSPQVHKELQENIKETQQQLDELSKAVHNLEIGERFGE